MTKAKVEVVEQNESGLNTKVSINGIIYTNNQAYELAKQGLVKGYHGVENGDGTKFIRSNPDDSENNNIE